MAVTVSLRSVVDELDCLIDECTAYLNRDTGELFTLPDEQANMVEDAADSDELPDWLSDEVPKIREVLQSDSWLALPTSFDIHEWAIMDGFGSSLPDPALSDELRSAIRGHGAFRMFRDVVARHGLRDEWHRYRMRALGRITADCLEANGVNYADDLDVSSG